MLSLAILIILKYLPYLTFLVSPSRSISIPIEFIINKTYMFIDSFWSYKMHRPFFIACFSTYIFVIYRIDSILHASKCYFSCKSNVSDILKLILCEWWRFLFRYCHWSWLRHEINGNVVFSCIVLVISRFKSDHSSLAPYPVLYFAERLTPFTLRGIIFAGINFHDIIFWTSRGSRFPSSGS